MSRDVNQMDKESRVSYLYGRTYDECYQIAKRYFTEEPARQSATATLYINAIKDINRVENYIGAVKKGLTEVPSQDRAVAYNIFKEVYADLIEKYPQADSALEHWVLKVGIVDPKEVKIRMVDYFYRQGLLLHYQNDFKVNSRTECEEFGDSTD